MTVMSNSYSLCHKNTSRFRKISKCLILVCIFEFDTLAKKLDLIIQPFSGSNNELRIWNLNFRIILQISESIICRNDELSWLFTNILSATRYRKVKRMGITEILRRIWLFSANKIKSSESFCKQPTQLIVELNSSLRHIIVTNKSTTINKQSDDMYLILIIVNEIKWAFLA